MKGPIKLGSLFKGRGTKKLKMHTVKINFKTIPLFIENENRIIERKQILHTHEVFQNEKKKTVYQEDYMNIMFDHLYQNKRNYSYERPRVEDFSKEKKIYLKSSFQFNSRPTSSQASPTNANIHKLIFKPLLQNKSQNNLVINNKESDENLKRKLLKYNYGKISRKNCKLNTFILPKCPPAIFVGPK